MDQKKTPRNDDSQFQEPSLEEIKEVVFSERNPERVSEFLNNILQKKIQEVPFKLNKIIHPIQRKPYHTRSFKLNNLFNAGKTKKAKQRSRQKETVSPLIQEILKEEKTSSNLSTKPVISIPKNEGINDQAPPKISGTPTAESKMESTLTKNIKIDPKPLPLKEKETSKNQKKTTKITEKDIIEKKDTPKKVDKKNKERKKASKKETVKPITKKSDKKPKLPKKVKSKDLEKGFLERQQRLSDIINKNDEGNVT